MVMLHRNFLVDVDGRVQRTRQGYVLHDGNIVLLGEDEVATNVLTVKTFATGEQTKVERALLISALRS